MATLTATEQRRLGLIRPELMRALLQLMDRAAEQYRYKLAVREYGGLRSLELQQALYEDALRQGGADTAYAVAKPGKSRHNYGAAFDVAIILGGRGAGGAGTDADYEQLAELGESLGLVAGFYFDARGVGKHDPYHFQLNETLEQSAQRWEAMKRAGIIRTAAAIGAAFLIVELVR